MKFSVKAASKKIKINHRKMTEGKTVEDYPRLLYHLLGTMQQEKRMSFFSISTVRQVELIIRHLLLGRVLNSEFLRKQSSMSGILSLAGMTRDAAVEERSIKYSDSIVSFVLMLVAQVTYLNEEVDAQDAVESALDPFKYNPDDALVVGRHGIKSVPGFREKHGFSVRVSNERRENFA